MNNQINDGGPAFPLQAHGDEARSRYYMTQQGVSMRDYFAAAALQGLLGNAEFHVDTDVESEIPIAIANHAYQAADAMLKARESKP
jgi:hypothetical protein